MTYDEYNKTRYSAPYIYILSKGNQHLYYFGSSHSFDPDDAQFDTIENFWNEFITKTEGDKRLTLLEGGNRPARETRERAILEGGEMHFVAYLAKKKNIKTFSPEPPERFRFEEMLKHFSKEAIVYYDFARICYQWNRTKVKPDFNEYLNSFLKRDQNNSGWHDFDFSIDHLVEIHGELFGEPFDKNNKEFFHDVINPTTELTIINKVSRFENSGFRDYYILEQIEKFWNEGNSIFIIYGKSHACMHEPVLKDLVYNG